MVKDVGASHVIVGHSERRRLFGESDAEIRARLDAALAAGLEVIFCLGETLAERQAGRTDEVVLRQLEAGVRGLPGETLARRVTIAYEPVWAIGTGVTATPAQAQEVHALLRRQLAGLAGQDAAARAIIQYGGSVKPDNIAELMDCADVDGALVGGASLEFPSFAALARLGAPAGKAR
jgi:triosephosphate isomerase